MKEIREPGRKRFYYQGSFRIDYKQIVHALAGRQTVAEVGSGDTDGQEIVLEFRQPDPAVQIVDEVKKLWDEGLKYTEIASRVGWNRNLVAEAIALWHTQRGLTPPDGRSCKKRLKPINNVRCNQTRSP